MLDEPKKQIRGWKKNVSGRKRGDECRDGQTMVNCLRSPARKLVCKRGKRTYCNKVTNGCNCLFC